MQYRFAAILFLCCAIRSTGFGQNEQDVLAYISRFKEMAISEMKRTGIPAAIKLAQGIHETEAGKSDLVTRSNNHFGIKCKVNWTGAKVFHDDDARGECFRSYARAEDSYTDHSNFLKNSQRYAFLFSIDPTDYEGWAYGLKKAGYATNVRYSQVLIRLIERYHLQDYTLIALGRMNDSGTNLATRQDPKLPPLPAAEDIIAGPEETIATPEYPAGPFTLNKTKVVYMPAGKAWLSIAEEHGISLSRLLDFNDLEEDDEVLQKGQLVFLQRKRKVGNAEFHVVQKGEDLYDICQSEAIRYESLLDLNHLNEQMLPAPGEKLYLQHPAPARPLLSGEQKTKATAAPGDLNAAAEKPAAFTRHLVTTKETLYSISKKYGVGPDQIKEWNRLDGLQLRIGQELIIYKNN